MARTGGARAAGRPDCPRVPAWPKPAAVPENRHEPLQPKPDLPVLVTVRLPPGTVRSRTTKRTFTSAEREGAGQGVAQAVREVGGPPRPVPEAGFHLRGQEIQAQ